MKCPNPLCNKKIDCSFDELDKLVSCPHCSTRLVSHFNIFDFFNINVNLFTIFGIFIAIVIILPTFSQVGIANLNATHVFYQPPYEQKLQMLFILENFFVVACTFMILLMATFILMNLFNGLRKGEVILYDCRCFTIRKDDIVRSLFIFPFVVLFFSLIFYIAILSGDFFQYYLFAYAIFEGLILLTFYLASKSKSQAPLQSK